MAPTALTLNAFLIQELPAQKTTAVVASPPIVVLPAPKLAPKDGQKSPKKPHAIASRKEKAHTATPKKEQQPPKFVEVNREDLEAVRQEQIAADKCKTATGKIKANLAAVARARSAPDAASDSSWSS